MFSLKKPSRRLWRCDGHFAAQNALLGIPDGASPASPHAMSAQGDRGMVAERSERN